MLSYWSNYYYLILLAQVLCVIHAMKTNRRDWIYIIILLPVVGIAAYFIREVLPIWNGGNAMVGQAQSLLFSGGRIKELEKQVRLADTVTNKQNLAYAYASQNRFDEAIALIKSCQDDLYSEDSGILLDLARLTFCNNQFGESASYFRKALALKNNRLDKPEDELLYARALDGAGEKEQAEEAYKKVIRLHHTLEAKYFYGMMLQQQGRSVEARAQFQAVLDEKDLHPPYVRRMNAPWVRAARKELAA
ncbi:tetratricopeptide repeat protein [Chitinophagaceae bacterium MMS25-I14]